MGSLAAVGVLGIADILICKGKLIKKLTGESKDLKVALERAVNAETELTINKNMLKFLKEELGLHSDNINDLMKELGATNIEELPRGRACLGLIRDMYTGINGFKRLDSRNKSCLLEWLDNYGYKFIDHTSPEYLNYNEYFMERSANVKERVTSVPILINTKTTCCAVGDGIIVNPL